MELSSKLSQDATTTPHWNRELETQSGSRQLLKPAPYLMLALLDANDSWVKGTFQVFVLLNYLHQAENKWWLTNVQKWSVLECFGTFFHPNTQKLNLKKVKYNEIKTKAHQKLA